MLGEFHVAIIKINSLGFQVSLVDYIFTYVLSGLPVEFLLFPLLLILRK